MAQISLRKIVGKKEALAVVQNLVKAMETAIRIEDASGCLLLGDEKEKLRCRYPVEVAGEPIGWVCGDEKGEAVASLLCYLAKQELEKKNLASELLEKYQEIDLFEDISTQITVSLELREVAQFAIAEAGKSIASTHGAIVLRDRESGELEIIAEFGEGLSPEQLLMLGEGLIGKIIDRGKGELINDTASDPRFARDREKVSALICAPLMTKERAIGAIAILNTHAVTYTAADMKRLSMFASQAAVAIEKALLYQQSRTAAIVAQDRAEQLQRTLHELQRMQAQLIQSEKMSGLGQLVAGVAHEINNPVNFIYGNLTHAEQYINDLLRAIALYQQHYPQPPEAIAAEWEALDLDFVLADLPNLIESMQVGAERIRQIVLSLRNFSRLEEAQMKPVDIHEGIDSTLLILQHRLKATPRNPGIQVIQEYGQLPKVECYASQLNQVFMNLIANAIDALEEQKEPRTITISTSVGDGAWGMGHGESNQWQIANYPSPITHSQSAVIRIRDNGPGIAEEVKKKLFEPFFTTKPVGKGTGLGLWISYQIVVEKHGGILTCLSQPGQGCEFVIQIPIACQKSSNQPARKLGAKAVVEGRVETHFIAS